jgi:hypothetical protein
VQTQIAVGNFASSVSETVLTALISGAAGLLGALAGFAGSFISSTRSARFAREQYRYSRTFERRDEVLANIYGALYEFYTLYVDKLGTIADMHLRDQDEHIDIEWDDLRNKLEKLNADLMRQSLWIPNEIEDDLAKLAVAIRDRASKLEEMVGGEIEREELEKELEEQSSWTRAEQAGNQFMRLREKMQRALGLEERDSANL